MSALYLNARRYTDFLIEPEVQRVESIQPPPVQSLLMISCSVYASTCKVGTCGCECMHTHAIFHTVLGFG